jgi:alkylation response protein AidB-like acyl-CoA dehydrogenase
MKPIHELAMAAPDVSRGRADDVIGWLRRYAEERIDSRLQDERRCVPPYVILDFGNRGILGMQIPEEFGGLALRHVDFLRILEQLAAIDLSLASIVFIHNANGIRPIVGYATPELRAELLPILAKGRELSAFCLTEPVAGSNLPNLATVATPDGQGGWRIRGAKRWNGSGWAGIVSVFARTAGDGGRLGHVTGFVVRQGTPGLRVGPESLTMGVRSIMQNSIFFDDVHAGPSQILGEVGKGMDVADEALLIARLCMGAMSLGAMKRCATMMLRYGTRRVVSTGRLIDSPITQEVVSRVTIKIALVQALVDSLVEVLDDGGYPPEEATMMAKIVASDSLWEVSDDLVETLGGRGYMENNIAPQIMRDCRMLRIGEGANELMTLSVGRRVNHSETLHEYLRSRLGCPELSDRLRDASERIQQRCLSKGAPFPDRSAALSWAFNLIGRVSIRGVVMAAAQAAARRAPSDLLDRAVGVASRQFETALDEALRGHAAESFMMDAKAITAVIAGYAGAIGDVEQAPPGIEEAIDPLLRRDPVGGGFPDLTHLPGNVDAAALARKPAPAAEAESLTPEQKRRLAAQLLRRRPELVVGTSSPGAPEAARESLS